MHIVINNKKIDVVIYKGFFKKLKGLMFNNVKLNKIILFNNCNSIHTFFMKQNIDICMTDKNNKILYLESNVKPNKIIIKKAYYTYEMPLNTAKYLNINEKFTIM